MRSIHPRSVVQGLVCRPVHRKREYRWDSNRCFQDRPLTNDSKLYPPAIWNSEVPVLIILPPFFVRRPCSLTAFSIRFSASPTSSSSSESRAFEVFLEDLLAELRALFLFFPLFLLVTAEGASRNANAFARCPRWRFLTWNRCFSSEGCVA